MVCDLGGLVRALRDMQGRISAALMAGFLCLSLAGPSGALDDLSYSFGSADKKLSRSLADASLLLKGERGARADTLDIFTAARADYGRLIGALYAQGYYAPEISILIDGREAADIPATQAPSQISTVRLVVDPGPRFRFAQARMRPYAPGTRLPHDYRDGQPAYSTAIEDAAQAGIDGWRRLGYAKARVADQSILADHANQRLQAEILLDAGPKLTFGRLIVQGNEHIAERRLRKITGYREGAVYNPAALEKVADRLRRTGVYRRVAITEAEQIGADGRLDISLDLEEEALRRYGFGLQASSADGADLSAFWLHRNLFGGAERLRIDGLVQSIGKTSGFTSYELGARIDRPATPTADSTAFSEATFSRLSLLTLDLRSYSLGFGLSRVLSEQLTVTAGVTYVGQTLSDTGFQVRFRSLALPVSVKIDRRDDILLPTKGSYLLATATPYWGLGTTDSGLQLKADARYYRTLAGEGDLVAAARLQIGSVFGGSILGTPPDYLFYSGGGGSVRGQPFQSLGVPVVRPVLGAGLSGGMSYAGLSGELRKKINERVGAVAFYDAGLVTADSGFGGTSAFHAGAGLGLRYETGFGPVRLDIAGPVGGNTGQGLQIYVGIGQAF